MFKIAGGGKSEITPELQYTASDEFNENIVSLLKYQADRGWTPKPFLITNRVRVAHPPVKPDAEVSLTVCEDARGTVLFDRSGTEAGKGVLAVQNLALKRVAGSMVIYDSTTEGVTACPFES